MMTPFKRLLACLMLACAVMLPGCDREEPIKLGFIAGQTGPYADLGAAGLHGAILATEQRNASGGVNGHPVMLIIRDDQFTTLRAKEQMQELVDQRITAVIGPMTSSMAREIVPIATASKTLLMGGSVASSYFDDHDDYFFRVMASNSVYAPAAARSHIKFRNPKQITVITDLANANYTEDWAKLYIAEMARQGGRNVVPIGFDSNGTRDVSALIDAALLQHPDLITLVCSPRTNAVLIREIRHRAPNIALATTVWGGTQQLVNDVGALAEGMLFESQYDNEDNSPTYKEFRQAYYERFQQVPDYAAVLAFEATHVLLDALAENPSRERLKETLLRHGKFQGVLHDITFNQFGDVYQRIHTLEVKQGRLVQIE